MIRLKDILQHYLFQKLHVFIVRHLVNSVIKSISKTIAKLCNKTVGWLKYRELKDHQNYI